MDSSPTQADFFRLVAFLDNCGRAANPPKLKPKNAIMDLLALSPVADSLLRSPEIRTFDDMMQRGQWPIEGGETLPPTRDGRISTLSDWMTRFPAHAWLRTQPHVSSALKSFRLVQKRSKSNVKLNDDLADLRFWQCAAHAGFSRDIVHRPSPDAAERKSAVKAARRLRQLCTSTKLLTDVGLAWNRQNVFLDLLDKVISVQEVEMRPRSDSHSADRDFIDQLTQATYRIFDQAPPSVIVALAGLRIASPDPVSITKRVKAMASYLATAPAP